MLELTYAERKRVHNLKYYTWVEQQQMNVEDLNAQWYDTKGTWDAVHAQAKDLDELINEFNEAKMCISDRRRASATVNTASISSSVLSQVQ